MVGGRLNIGDIGNTPGVRKTLEVFVSFFWWRESPKKAAVRKTWQRRDEWVLRKKPLW
jgi:hypothetical protein